MDLGTQNIEISIKSLGEGSAFGNEKYWNFNKIPRGGEASGYENIDISIKSVGEW